MKQYVEGRVAIWYTTMYQAVRCKGAIYVQLFDCVYRLDNDGFTYVAEIPELLSSHSVYFYGKIFSQNNELYASNGYKSYLLRGDEFIYQN